VMIGRDTLTGGMSVDKNVHGTEGRIVPGYRRVPADPRGTKTHAQRGPSRDLHGDRHEPRDVRGEVAWRIEYGYRWLILAATVLLALVGIIPALMR
jgi:hypothetical protein